MNSMVTRVLNRNLLLCFYLLSSLPLLNAQLTVTTERPTAHYSVGSTANFIISSTASGTATYKFYYDNKTIPITTGSIPLNAGQSTILPYRHTESGVVLCSVTQNGVTKMSAVAFSPMEITPAEAEPTDFDAFWNSQKNLINSVPLAPQVSLYRQGYGFSTYKLSLGSIEGRRVYGYISVPESTPSNTITGPFPAIISLPSYGDAPGVCSPDEVIPQQGKAICVSLSVHNTDPLIQDPNAYKPNIITDKAGFYYRYALLGVVQTINYLFTRPDFNKTDLGIVGTSQGGGLALCAAGLDNRIKLVAISNPALCEHSAFKIGKASGFPYYLNLAKINNTEALSSVAVKYYDAVNFAKRVQGVTYAVVGYQDDVTPAATTFAAIAQLRQKTLVFHSPQLGHAHPEEYWSGRMAFFREYFPSMTQLPLQVTLSHAADVGADKTVSVGQALSLSGIVKLNGAVDNAMSVRWEKISGAGTVTLSDPFNRNTQANFSAAGTYVLRFSATDNRFLNGKVFVAIDYITVTVDNNTPPPPPPPTTEYCEAKGRQPWHNWIERIENESGGYDSFKDTYGNFTDKIFRVERGSNSVFQLTPGYAWLTYPLNWRIWIDFNEDKDFSDPGEMVGSILGTDRLNVNVAIPASVSLGNKRIRIAMQRDTFPNACGVYDNGEVEDYTLNISDPSATASPPPPSYGSSNNTNYCTAGGVASNVWISWVRFGDLTYNSVKEGYGNFIHKSFTIAKGQGSTLALKPNFAGAPADVFWKVWMDYDRDGHFSLSENIWSSQGKDAVNTLMFMPSNLVSGIPYRMRVVMRQGTPPLGYCGIVDAGEIEDYTVFFTTGSQNSNYNVFREQIQLYPNPVSEELTIDLNAYGGGKGALRIYDSFGNMVWEMPEDRFPNRQIKLDVANFQDGIYCLMTEGAGLRILLDKFVVLKQR